MNSCSLIGLTGETVSLAGKTASALVKTSGTIIQTSGKLGGMGANKLFGKRTIRLEKEGNLLYVVAKLNRNLKTRLALDTGASTVQISSKVAKLLDLNLSKGEITTCELADGSLISATLITLDEIKIGRVKVKDVETVVIDDESKLPANGLLGMSFLKEFNFSIDTEQNLLIVKRKSP
jgi:clan AA aspartic protease (TIGR02281 family)